LHEPFLNSGWDTFLIAAPFIGLLLAGLFRLDALLAAPGRPSVPKSPAIGIDGNGRTFLSDPDGRRWYIPDSSNDPGVDGSRNRRHRVAAIMGIQ
jgi:hypothetical protein